MSRFGEKGYYVKENAAVYFTKNMDDTVKWFEYGEPLKEVISFMQVQ